MDKRTTFTIGGAAVAGVLAGAALAAAVPALAETAPTPSATDSTTAPADRDPSKGGHRANGITEELLTGDTAQKVTDAVLAKYPDATIQRVETDAEGAAYEAHILQGDGTSATVKLDDSFAVTGLETRGTGGPGGHGRGYGPDDGSADDDSAADGSADDAGDTGSTGS